MQGSPARTSKWTLTQESLDVFLSYLDHDRDRAGEKYENIRQKLLTFFRCNGCCNVEDPSDETIDRVIRRLGEVRDLMPFIRGVARVVLSEIRKKAKKGLQVPLSEVPEPRQPTSANPKDEREIDRRMRCIDRCVPLLDDDDRELITQWYVHAKGEKIENKRELAALRHVSVETLRVQAFRARERLRKLVVKCLESSPTM